MAFPPRFEHNALEQVYRPNWQGSGSAVTDHGSLVPGGGFIDAAQFPADADGKKFIMSGTLIGRTYAERDAGTGYGPADIAADNEIYLLAYDVTDATKDIDCELYYPGLTVYENFLPNWDTLPAPVKAWIRTKYVCITAIP